MQGLWKKRAKKAAITAGLEAAHLISAARLMRGARGRGAIFTLHHVRPYEAHDFEPNAHLEITPEFLDAALTRLKQDGYEFVALADVPALLSGPAREAPFAAFTLDDGYRNNLVHAYPIFEKHEAPFTIFVAKGLTERTHTIWWETLTLLLRRTDRLHFDFGRGEEVLETDTPAEQYAAFARFAAFLHMSDEEKAVPMPESGAVRPVFNALRTSLASPDPGSSVAIVSRIEPIVASRPQKVPSRPRNTSNPIR